MITLKLGDLSIRLKVVWLNPSRFDLLGTDLILPRFRRGVLYYKYDKEVVAKIYYEPKSRLVGKLLLQNRRKVYDTVMYDYVKHYGYFVYVVYVDGSIVKYRARIMEVDNENKFGIRVVTLHDVVDELGKYYRTLTISEEYPILMVLYNGTPVINRQLHYWKKCKDCYIEESKDGKS